MLHLLNKLRMLMQDVTMKFTTCDRQEVVFIFQIMIRQESPSSSFCKLQFSVKAS